MSAFAVSLLVLACCGIAIVAGALLRMYGAERRRRRPEVAQSTPVADNESASRKSRS